jgi:hypothetical protein
MAHIMVTAVPREETGTDLNTLTAAIHACVVHITVRSALITYNTCNYIIIIIIWLYSPIRALASPIGVS